MADARRRIPLTLAGLTVLLEISYAVAHGSVRTALTVATVVVFFLASVTHATAVRGAAWTAVFVLVTVGGGLLAEATGVATGLPFGEYHYTGTLGPRLLGVPLVVPLAWAMMAYPAYVAAGRLVTRPLPHGLLTGYALASWDLFLDPQMVDAGHWRWSNAHPALPGVPHVPVSNYAGWLAVAVLMGLVLAFAPARGAEPRADAVPVALYLWTYASSVLAHAAFFRLPGSAVWGGLAMGLVAVPVAGTVARR